MGLSTVVKRGHSQPGVDLTYITSFRGRSRRHPSAAWTASAAFVDQNWKTSGGTMKDRFQYGYDRNSKPLVEGQSRQ